MSDELRFDPGNAKQVGEAIKRHEPAFMRAAQAGLRSLTDTWSTQLRSRFTGWYGGLNRTGATPRGRLRSGSGNLKQSIGGHVRGDSTANLRAILRVGGGDSRNYVQLQELGTRGAGGVLPDITPKKGKYLTVPTKHALTTGGDKKTGAELHEDGGRWTTTEFGPTFIRHFGGTPIIFAKKTPRSRAIPLYTLRKKVAVKPRLGAYTMFMDVQETEMERLVDKFIVIAGGGKG